MIKTLNKENLKSAVKHLCKVDKDLDSIYKTDGVPPLWSRKPCFSTLIQIIIEQQVSLASAKAINKNLQNHIKPFTPSHFLKIEIIGLRNLGLTRQKSSYCINVAKAVIDDKFNFSSLNKLNDENVKKELMMIKGVGSWTADIYLLMAMKRPDIYPKGDIALAKAMKKIKRLKKLPSIEKQLIIAEKWKPYRAVAARMLWQHYIKNKL